MFKSQVLHLLLVLMAFPLGIYALLTVFLFFFQTNLIYFPDKQIIATPHELGLPYDAVDFNTEDGAALSGWFIPGSADSVVLFCHGNAGNISHRLESLEIFHQLGLSTFIFDYRGYGQSRGRTTEEGTYKDAEAAWNYLVSIKGIPRNKIIIFGRSLGGAVAAYLAAKKDPAALILESTFTSLPALGGRLYPLFPVKYLSRFDYNTVDYLRLVSCPVLVIHSQSDDIVPFDMGVDVHQAAPVPKEFLEIEGDHNSGFLISGQSYVTGLRSFINKYVRN